MKPTRFRDATGGYAFSEVYWYNILRIIEDFIEEIYGVSNFFEKPIDTQLARIDLLANVQNIVYEKWKIDPAIKEDRPQTSVFDLVDNIKVFTQEEFEWYLLPMVEAAFVWGLNKRLGPTTAEYRAYLAKRIRDGKDIGNFYGYLFEVCVSGFYVYGGWKPKRPKEWSLDMVSDRLDWIFRSGTRVIGVECGDKRMSLKYKGNPTYSDIDGVIAHARPKFKACPDNLDRKLVFINLTKPDYLQPVIEDLPDIIWDSYNIGYFQNIFDLGPYIDGVVLYWREKRERKHSTVGSSSIEYKARFALTEIIDKKTDLPNVWPLIEVRPNHAFYITKDMEIKPTFGKAGPVETAEDYYNQQIDTAKKLANEKREDAQRWIDLGDTYQKWANHLFASGDHERAYDNFLEACRSYEHGANIDANTDIYYKWAISLYSLARVLGSVAKWQEAEWASNQSIEKFSMATYITPNMYEAYHGWARMLWYLSVIQINIGRPIQALYYLEEAFTRYNNASEGKNNLETVYYDWGNALVDAAYLHYRFGHPNKSICTLGEACAKYCISTRIATDFLAYNRWGFVLNSLAIILQKQGRVDQSWKVLLNACNKYDKASEIAPSEAQIFWNWRAALAIIAALLYERGENIKDWLVLIEELKKLILKEKWLI